MKDYATPDRQALIAGTHDETEQDRPHPHVWFPTYQHKRALAIAYLGPRWRGAADSTHRYIDSHGQRTWRDET